MTYMVTRKDGVVEEFNYDYVAIHPGGVLEFTSGPLTRPTDCLLLNASAWTMVNREEDA